MICDEEKCDNFLTIFDKEKYDKFLAIFDKEKCENFLKIFDKEKYDNFLAIFDKEKYENLSLQLLHLVSSRDGALQAWYVERSLQHWISSDNNDPR